MIVVALTPLQQLAGYLLERPLSEYVAEKRSGRPIWTWQEIAEQISDDTNGQVIVTRQTLRRWYRDELAAAA